MKTIPKQLIGQRSWDGKSFTLANSVHGIYSACYQRRKVANLAIHSLTYNDGLPIRCAREIVAQSLWKQPTQLWFDSRTTPRDRNNSWHSLGSQRTWDQTGHKPREKSNSTGLKNKKQTVAIKWFLVAIYITNEFNLFNLWILHAQIITNQCLFQPLSDGDS